MSFSTDYSYVDFDGENIVFEEYMGDIGNNNDPVISRYQHLYDLIFQRKKDNTPSLSMVCEEIISKAKGDAEDQPGLKELYQKTFKIIKLYTENRVLSPSYFIELFYKQVSEEENFDIIQKTLYRLLFSNSEKDFQNFYTGCKGTKGVFDLLISYHERANIQDWREELLEKKKLDTASPFDKKVIDAIFATKHNFPNVILSILASLCFTPIPLTLETINSISSQYEVDNTHATNNTILINLLSGDIKSFEENVYKANGDKFLEFSTFYILHEAKKISNRAFDVSVRRSSQLLYSCSNTHDLVPHLMRILIPGGGMAGQNTLPSMREIDPRSCENIGHFPWAPVSGDLLVDIREARVKGNYSNAAEYINSRIGTETSLIVIRDVSIEAAMIAVEAQKNHLSSFVLNQEAALIVIDSINKYLETNKNMKNDKILCGLEIIQNKLLDSISTSGDLCPFLFDPRDPEEILLGESVDNM